MTRKQEAMLERILLTFIIHVPMVVIGHMDMLPAGLGTWGKPAVYLISYVLTGWDTVCKALRNIWDGQVFDEGFLMTVATLGAFGVGEYSEAVTIMLLYQVGGLFQSYAMSRPGQSITELISICPEYVNIEEDGQLKQVDPGDVQVGDVIVVKAGGRIPLDGKVVFGDPMVNISAPAGESVPRKASVKDDVVNGCVSGNSLLRIQVTKELDGPTVAKILELMENASSKRAQVESFITRFARYYTPTVVMDAMILVVLPSLVFGQSWAKWMRRACTFLAISCPYALVISIPMSSFSGIDAALGRGVLIKRSNYLEVLPETDIIVFDKIGTLAKDEFKVTEIHAAVGTQEPLLKLVAPAESYSGHPVSHSIKGACSHALGMNRISDTGEISGHGVRAAIGGHVVLAGNSKLMKEMKVEYTESSSIGTAICIAMDGTSYGSIIISDTIREEAYEAIRSLKRVGVKWTVMLTDGKKEMGEVVTTRLGLGEVHAGLPPDGKVTKVEGLLAELKGRDRLASVGDEIDDAPMLSRADIGIAVGSMGSDAAVKAADIVLMDDDPSKIADMVCTSHKIMTTVKQNIILTLGAKTIVPLMGAFGTANIWEAISADMGMSVITIISAVRALSL